MAALFSMSLFNAERDLPIVYSEEYNINMLGVELLHQFDTRKYSKIAGYLNEDFLDTPWSRHLFPDEIKSEKNPQTDKKSATTRQLRFLKPNRFVTIEELGLHHNQDYLDQLHNDKSLVARITETWALNMCPMSMIENRLLKSLKLQVAGTIFAFYLAMQHGWALNLGGGFHQASSNDGSTFCIFSDILVAMKHVWRKRPLNRFLIIDLDAHQATGVERDLLELDEKKRSQVFIFDQFNSSINPPDPEADKGINLRVEMPRFASDETYINALETSLKEAFRRFKPTMVIYVAGQDVLKNDQLGLLNVSEATFKRRDELVFSWAVERIKRPIVMLLGGGYMARGARVQATSIKNLFSKGLIWGGHRSGSRSLSRPRRNQPASKLSKEH